MEFIFRSVFDQTVFGELHFETSFIHYYFLLCTITITITIGSGIGRMRGRAIMDEVDLEDTIEDESDVVVKGGEVEELERPRDVRLFYKD